jgi:adenine deaminase
MASRKTVERLIRCAQVKEPADLLLAGARYLDVFTLEWREGEVTIADGHIVALEAGIAAKREIPAKGKWLVPGFIDAHLHVESSLMVPVEFARTVLPKGTTTAVCDPHELTNVLGVEALEYFLGEAERLPINLRVMLSSCVPATAFESNGGGVVRAADLVPFLSHPRALGLAEMMNVPGVLSCDPLVMEKIETFVRYPIDGHCPLVSGQALSAYAAAGISSCHESTGLLEAREKLTKGIACWIREGSVAKDLHALAPLLNAATSPVIGFCTDDRNPLDIANEGHLDFLVRGAIRLGGPAPVAYRSASWSVARHYRLARLGAVAPGYIADLVLLDDSETVAISRVLRAGTPVEELSFPERGVASYPNTIRAKLPELVDLTGPAGQVHVIEVEAGKILTGRSIRKHDEIGVARLSVLERYGKGSRPANAYVRGFGEKFRGALAASVGHDSHNLIVVGSSPDEMRVALASLVESGGGYVAVQSGKVLAKLALPFGGLMTAAPAATVSAELKRLREASRALGCELPEPFLQLAFLSLPVIPSLKLTDRGLFDVNAFRLISVAA